MFGRAQNRVNHWMTFHRQGKEQNVFILSSPRSGSTWLFELLATQGRFKLVNEPFNLRKPWIRENLGLNNWEDLFQSKNKPLIKEYLQSFIDDRDKDVRFRRERPFSPYWHLRTDRVIFKILFAGEDDIDWYRRTFGGHVIFLLRHPISVSLSRKELPRLGSFLVPPFSEFFTADQLAYVRRTVGKQDHFQMAVVDWCLQNAIPLRDTHPKSFVVSYEQMVLEPELVVAHLVKKFALQHPEKMRQHIFKASRSTGKSSAESKTVLMNDSELRTKRQWLVNKWKEKVDESQERIAFETLDVFGIDYYAQGRSLPQDRYCLSHPENEEGKSSSTK